MRFDVDHFMRHDIGLIILIGFAMFLATFLGPLGILLMLAGIGAIAYVLLHSIRQ